jgi:hypothetical protein
LPGNIKEGKGTLIGNAGEYGVMAELLKRGWIAALTPRNAPDFDIMATDGQSDVRIRVKTKSHKFDTWQWRAKKDGTVIKHASDTRDFVVLVDLREGTIRNDYYILPTHELSQRLIDDFAQWIATPGVRGQQHDPENQHRILSLRRYKERLEPNKEAWDLLWKGEGSGASG